MLFTVLFHGRKHATFNGRFLYYVTWNIVCFKRQACLIQLVIYMYTWYHLYLSASNNNKYIFHHAWGPLEMCWPIVRRRACAIIRVLKHLAAQKEQGCSSDKLRGQGTRIPLSAPSLSLVLRLLATSELSDRHFGTKGQGSRDSSCNCCPLLVVSHNQTST